MRTIFALAAAILFLIALWRLSPDTVGAERQAYILRGGVFVIVVVALLDLRRNLSRQLADLAIWALIGVAILAVYTYRFELQAVGNRITAELAPARPVAQPDGSVTLRKTASGDFQVDATVDDTPIRFVIDSGASGIVLSPADARRLGIDPKSLRFIQFFQTANGVTRGAPVRLATLRIGPLTFTDVAASVNEADLQTSLLGMTLLEKLSSVEMHDNTLTLRK